jgi:hypothetical protein
MSLDVVRMPYWSWSNVNGEGLTVIKQVCAFYIQISPHACSLSQVLCLNREKPKLSRCIGKGSTCIPPGGHHEARLKEEHSYMMQ